MLESYLQEKIKEVKETSKLNYEMMDKARSYIAWILEMSEKYNKELDDIQRLQYLYKKSGQILENDSPTESQQRNKTTEDSTEPKFLFKLYIIFKILYISIAFIIYIVI